MPPRLMESLINMYMKCGVFKEGHLVFDNIKNRDIISWNSLIGGYGMHGLGENALRTFDQMIKSGMRPDNITFVAVLSACSHAGLVAAEASDIVRNMPIEPNECVWGALLNSCRMYRNTDVVEELASQILGLKSEITGSFMLLSNIYSANGRWEDSARVRVSAKNKGFKKIPGQSWIEVRKKVYTFTAGNVVHLEQGEIYAILDELALQMASVNYTINSCFDQQCICDQSELFVAN
ncbi:unnamed protein product [Trifolium pratense]|uniref:Uncharacterized protein n=1 Tax=Trifolium pratense TaxID=57577 RepID=A0ACB0KIA8_TRIPR|nr:unnamed protein product [Trifolium pratense]